MPKETGLLQLYNLKSTHLHIQQAICGSTGVSRIPSRSLHVHNTLIKNIFSYFVSVLFSL